jgi:hypothetical protein
MPLNDIQQDIYNKRNELAKQKNAIDIEIKN